MHFILLLKDIYLYHGRRADILRSFCGQNGKKTLHAAMQGLISTPEFTTEVMRVEKDLQV